MRRSSLSRARFASLASIFSGVALALCCGALSPAPALAKLDNAEWTKVETQMRALLKEAGSSQDKLALVAKLVEDGEPRAWRLVAEAVVAESVHLTRMVEAQQRDMALLQPYLGMKYSDMRPADLEERRKLQSSIARIEVARAGDAKVVAELLRVAGAAGLEVRKAIYLAARTHADGNARAAAGRLAALMAEEESSKLVLSDLLDKEKDPRVKGAVLEALETAPGTWWHPLVVPRVEDADWGVQVLAARLAGKREIGRAIPALIHSLGKASPRVAEEVLVALRRLTGENAIEADGVAWAKWWEANRNKWGEDGRPVGSIGPPPARPIVDYYGIKVRSDKVMFLLDISGSMLAEKQAPATTPPAKPEGPITGGAPPKPVEGPRQKFSGPKIEIAKQELKRVLKTLPKECSFGIIAFNHAVTLWQPKMMPATENNKELAYAFIRDLAPAGGTYIDGALRTAFTIAGAGVTDKAYGLAVDTIFLLSDGAPTDNTYPDVLEMPPDEIIGHVETWNPQHRVIIHCVGIDNVVQGIDFMKRLAKANGGTYVDG